MSGPLTVRIPIPSAYAILSLCVQLSSGFVVKELFDRWRHRLLSNSCSGRCLLPMATT